MLFVSQLLCHFTTCNTFITQWKPWQQTNVFSYCYGVTQLSRLHAVNTHNHTHTQSFDSALVYKHVTLSLTHTCDAAVTCNSSSCKHTVTLFTVSMYTKCDVTCSTVTNRRVTPSHQTTKFHEMSARGSRGLLSPPPPASH